ncbi:Uncharacterised protein [Klebsiella aerogenes]|nr:Uncharacterised protein [Klebsiella aerogenes]
MADVFEQQLIVGVQVVILRGGHLFQHVRVAANSPLTEDHHAAGQNVGAFNGDGDRRALVSPGEEVTFAQHNAFPAGNIHRVDNGALAAVGTVIFHNRGQHCRFLAEHNAVGDQRRRGVHHIGVTRDARQRLFNPFHFADRDFELTANVGVGAGRHGDGFQAAGGVGRQGNAAAHGQTFNQHAPALTGHARAADDVIDRHEDILAAGWAVLERDVQREVATANFHARR